MNAIKKQFELNRQGWRINWRYNMTRFDWIFVTVFYFGGMTLLMMGIDIMDRFAGAGLFGALAGLVMTLTATYHIKLEEYR